MTITDYFSADYGAARVKFLDACSGANARVENFENPKAGPDGEPLFTDVADLGPGDAQAVLVLGSATHGAEGFCGSGIQTGLLRDGLASRLGAGQRVVMIHAINPFGFAHLRRVNEDNIDLNRNFVDHSGPYPANPDYDALAGVIAPRAYWPLVSGASIVWLQIHRMTRGKAKVAAAITGGQHTHPQGLFYGGQAQTWSNGTIRAIAQRYLQSAPRVVFVDFHTGLGPHGHGEMISGDEPGAPAHQRAVAWWGNRVKAMKAGESVSADLTGTVKLAIGQMLPGAEVTGITLEFGTVGPIRVLRALQAENWLHHHGGPGHPRARAIKAEMRRVFYPDTDDWKARVWDQGREVVDQALAGLSHPP